MIWFEFHWDNKPIYMKLPWSEYCVLALKKSYNFEYNVSYYVFTQQITSEQLLSVSSSSGHWN